MPKDELNETMLSLLGKLPGVEVEEKAKRLAFLVGKKVFAFKKDQAMTLKLPEAKIEELIKKKRAAFLVMGKRQMKEWALLERSKPADFKQDLPLFKEAMAFVSKGG